MMAARGLTLPGSEGSGRRPFAIGFFGSTPRGRAVSSMASRLDVRIASPGDAPQWRYGCLIYFAPRLGHRRPGAKMVGVSQRPARSASAAPDLSIGVEK